MNELLWLVCYPQKQQNYHQTNNFKRDTRARLFLVSKGVTYLQASQGKGVGPFDY